VFNCGVQEERHGLWFKSFHCREKQTTGLFEFELGVCKLESMAGVGKKMEENPLEVEQEGNGVCKVNIVGNKVKQTKEITIK
jgi:hypothetical protein